MMNKSVRLFKVRTAFYLLAAVYLLLAFYVFGFKSVNIDTDLRKLSPELTLSPSIDVFIDRFTRASQKKIVIAFISEDSNDIEEAIYQLEGELENSELLNLNDTSTVLDELAAFVSENQFSLITDGDRHWLESADNEAIQTFATGRLYNTDAPIRFIPITEDPLSLTNQYLLDLLGKIPGGAEESAGGVVKVLELQGDALDLNAQARISKELDAIIQHIEDAFDGIEVLKTGVFVFASEAAQESKKDIQFISGLSMFGVGLIIMGFFRSVRPLIFCVCTVFIGLSGGALASLALFSRVHILTLVFGASLIGVVVDYALHHYYFYSDKHQLAQNKKTLTKALLFSCTTSIIGYAALSVSDMSALKQVAVFSISGLLCACVFVIALGAGAYFHPREGASPPSAKERKPSSLVRLFPVRNTKSLSRLLTYYCCAFFALLVIAVFLSPVRSLDDPRGIFKPDEKLIADERRISQLQSDFEPASFLVIEADSESSLFDAISTFSSYAGNVELFGVQTLFPSPSARVRNYDAQVKLYSGEAPALMFLDRLGVKQEKREQLKAHFQSSKDADIYIDRFFTDNTNLPALLFRENNTAWQSIQLIEKGQDIPALKAAAEKFESVRFVDLVGDTKRSLRDLRVRASMLFILAFLIVSILILARYQRVSDLKMMLVPLASILSVLVGFSYFQVAVTLFHVLAMFLVLGLGMDYVIFARDLNTHRSHTLTAILLSGLTSLLSFGLLSASSFPLVHAFGLTVLIGNGVNLLATYLYMLGARSRASELGYD